MGISRELRRPETKAKYQLYLKEKRDGCPFCFTDGVERRILKKYNYWYITENLFPYDVDYEVSHILVTSRHLESIWDLNEEEQAEYLEIRAELSGLGKYNELLENFPSTRSQIHYHVHLLAY